MRETVKYGLASSRISCPLGKNPPKLSMSTKTQKRKARRLKQKQANDGRAIANLEKSVGRMKQKPVIMNSGRNSKYGYRNFDMGQTNPESLKVLERKLGSSYDAQFFDYLASLAHPWTVTDAIIPDWTTFPRGTAQVRTNATVHMGTTATDNTFTLVLVPALQKSGYFVAPASASPSYIVVDGVKYGPGQAAGNVFNIHDFATWASMLDSYRVVSMGVKASYAGSPLTASGKIACGCFPPQVNGPTSYQDISEYNYSYVGSAIDGCSQVLMAAGMDAFNLIDIGDTFGTGDFSYLIVSCAGLPTGVDTLQIDWVINIETYSEAQILTANAVAGKPDAQKMSVSQAAMAKVHRSKGLGGREKDSKNIAKKVLTTGAELAVPLASALGPEGALFGHLAKGALSLLSNVV